MFTATEFRSVSHKEKLFRKLVKFLIEGCKPEKFTKALYKDVMQMFGFIAHYNHAGFTGHYFDTSEDKKRFIQSILKWPCYGDPAFTCSDVERELQSWVRANIDDVIAAIQGSSPASEIETNVPAPWILVDRSGTVTVNTLPMSPELKDAVESAIHSFGYILPKATVLPFTKVADLMVKHNSAPQTAIIANTLRAAS